MSTIPTGSAIRHTPCGESFPTVGEFLAHAKTCGAAQEGEYEVRERPTTMTAAEGAEAVRGAVTALGGTWSAAWLDKLRLAAELLEWFDGELDEVRRVAEEEAREINATLDRAGVRPYTAILAGQSTLERIYNGSAFDTVVRLRDVLADRLTSGNDVRR